MTEQAHNIRTRSLPRPVAPPKPSRAPGRGGASTGEHAPSPSPRPVTGELEPLHEAAVRGLNLMVALAILILLSPILALIAVAIKLDSTGPVLYRQIRVGVDRRGRRRGGSEEEADANRRTGDLGGVPIVIYKFRTMHVDAERESGPTWSSPDDDRTTRVGRFLRRHRLDELPQLWNVLKGDMAVVGPRPERPLFFQTLREEIERYPRRQTVPPGITGWAQINQDSDQCVDDVQQKVRYDLEYLERRSLWFDAWIMVRTPIFMIRRDLLSRPGDEEDEGEGTAGGDQGAEVGSAGRASSAGNGRPERRIESGEAPITEAERSA